MVDWHIVAERFHWQPSEIDGLAVTDLFEHADVARTLYEKEAKARTKPS